MLHKSKTHNPNYLAQLVEIDKFKEIDGANTIKIAIVNYQEVIVSKDTKIGDRMVYFPVE